MLRPNSSCRLLPADAVIALLCVGLQGTPQVLAKPATASARASIVTPDVVLASALDYAARISDINRRAATVADIALGVAWSGDIAKAVTIARAITPTRYGSCALESIAVAAAKTEHYDEALALDVSNAAKRQVLLEIAIQQAVSGQPLTAVDTLRELNADIEVAEALTTAARKVLRGRDKDTAGALLSRAAVAVDLVYSRARSNE